MKNQTTIAFIAVILIGNCLGCKKDPLISNDVSFNNINTIDIVSDSAVNNNNNNNEEELIVKSSIKFEISNIKEEVGRINVALFNSEDSYNKEEYLDTRILEFTGNSVVGEFSDLEPGVYVVSCYHDKNLNQELDKNILGIPTEGFGFSNNPQILFDAPDYNNVKFNLNDNAEVFLQINLKHF
jgi:uncharacterized protein (DUF2141 family)